MALTMSGLITSCAETPESSGQPHDFHPKVVLDDFLLIEGDGWSGSLTYLNYNEPEEEFSIPVNLGVGREGSVLKLALSYPDEPSADEVAEIEIYDEGRSMNGAEVISRDEEEGSIDIHTQAECQDNNRAAECLTIYELSATKMTISKRVTYDGETESFRRNYYEFSRPAPTL
ncbi:MAG: hypothetical protein WA989_11720 [Henriciella sp.]|uniref:hypothetical protein n=1 Tax=Henriciella sp. TaxID=1968823 RepID=UPI003C7093BE